MQMRKSSIKHGRLLCVRRQGVIECRMRVIDIVVKSASVPEGRDTNHAAKDWTPHEDLIHVIL